MAMFDYGPCDWLVLPLLLPTRQPSFHWIISNGVVNGIRRNGDVLILPTRAYDSAYDFDFRFSLGHLRLQL